MKNLFSADGSNHCVVFEPTQSKLLFDKNEYQKKWVTKNKESRAEHQRKYREKKKEEIKKLKSDWYKRNAEEVKRKARLKYRNKILNL